jgi:transcriptional regulator with GAF, ATPase, and Fis domain
VEVELQNRLRRIARSDASVLITGETGVGKEVAADFIQQCSNRAKHPYVKINCAAVEDNLLGSELFGHVRGAFTDAHRSRDGKFTLANSGTLFLDEIGEMSFPLQAKLLRVLQSGEFSKIGGNEVFRSDVRIIAATNTNIGHRVLEKQFREDLMFRLAVMTVEIPPLRARRDIIIKLALEFITQFYQKINMRFVELTDEARDKLLNYSWPGNIRELMNVMERASIVSDGGVVNQKDIVFQAEELIEAFPISNPVAYFRDLNLVTLEREVIVEALERTSWVQKDAAQLLGISSRVMSYKIRNLGLTHRKWSKYK